METITPVAQSLSTYGLYAIVAILAIVVVYLYKRVSDLEKELRTTIQTNASESSKLIIQTTEALKDNARAFTEFQTTLSELKTAIQFAMEKISHERR